jgi:hypothetical protein
MKTDDAVRMAKCGLLRVLIGKEGRIKIKGGITDNERKLMELLRQDEDVRIVLGEEDE